MVKTLSEHLKPWFTAYKNHNIETWTKKCWNLLYKTKKTWEKLQKNLQQTCMEHDRNMNKHIFKTSEISNLLNN
jgi:hypothetical protein